MQSATLLETLGKGLEAFPVEAGVFGALGSIRGLAYKAGDLAVTFESAHFADRILDVGLDLTRVKVAVTADIVSIEKGGNLQIGASFSNRIVIDEVPEVYRAFPLKNGRVDVPTIHPDDLRWMKR